METDKTTLSLLPQESQPRFFSCGICHGAPFEPVATSCGHLYCWECLFSFAGLQNRQNFNCPACRLSLQLKQLTSIYVNSDVSGNRSEKIPVRPQYAPQLSEKDNQPSEIEAEHLGSEQSSNVDLTGQVAIAGEELLKIVPLLIILMLPYLFETISGTSLFTFFRRRVFSEMTYRDIRQMARNLVALGYHSWLQAFTFGCFVLLGIGFLNALSAKAFKRQR
jgi:hypothetical protein